MPRLLSRTIAVLLSVVMLAAAVQALTPPAGAQAGATVVVREGYERMLALYVDPLPPDGLLTEAWNGAAGAAIAAGVDRFPALGTLPPERREAWSAFALAFGGLEQAGTGFISGSRLAHAAVGAMAQARGECHTYFLPPERYAAFRAQLVGQGRTVGVGVQITTGPPFTIAYVYPDSPAARAGIAAGDQIVAVDGVPAAEQTPATLSALLRGQEGTRVTIAVRREGEAAPRAVTVTRGVIPIPVLTSSLRPDRVGVITMNIFASDGSSEELLRGALADLEAQGATGWVLDLRANPGGAVESLHAVLGVFLSEDVTATTWVSRTGGRVRFPVTGEPSPVQRPLAVLVGRSSASAAEIAAAVLQDTGRAEIFGQHTAGCANVGTVTSLSDGSGLAVTSARILAGPNERPLDGAGVTPDVETRLGAADPALQAAVAWLLAPTPVTAAP